MVELFLSGDGGVIGFDDGGGLCGWRCLDCGLSLKGREDFVVRCLGCHAKFKSEEKDGGTE